MIACAARIAQRVLCNETGNSSVWPSRAAKAPANLSLASFSIAVQFLVGACRIVVKQRKPARTGRLTELDALLPCRVPVTAMAFHFLLGVGAVVNDEVGIFDQAEHRLIEFARLVLGVCDHRHDTAAPFDPIAYAAARMD